MCCFNLYAEKGNTVSLVEILSSPNVFDGKRVVVRGYIIVNERRGPWQGYWLSIYRDEFDPESSVLLDIDEKSELFQHRKNIKDGGFYLVSGRFHSCEAQVEMCSLRISNIGNGFNSIDYFGREISQ